MPRKPKLVKDGDVEKKLPKIQRGALEAVIAAFEDASKNRLSLPETTRIHNATTVARTAQYERDALRAALIRQYDESGKGWEKIEDAPPELVSKVMELFKEVVELDFGPSLKVKEPDSFSITGESYGLLKQVGFIE